MLLDVAVHFELQTVLVLDQAHEAQVPAVAEPEDLIQPRDLKVKSILAWVALLSTSTRDLLGFRDCLWYLK